MQSPNVRDTFRRSSRVQATLPILVTSLESGTHFSEICETLVVSAHGCAVHSPMRLGAGIPVHFHSKEGRQTMAHVVDCAPMGPDQPGWRLGVRFDRPENFWGLKACPEDWVRLPGMSVTTEQQLQGKPQAATSETIYPMPDQVAPLLNIVLDKIQKQLSDDHLRAMVNELLQPLQAEVADLREKLARGEPKRSRFEVSLSHIPPEVEEKLWMRLQQDLGTQILQRTCEQSEQVLEQAKAVIEQTITAAEGQVRQQIAQQLQAVEQKTHDLLEGIADRVQRHIGAGLEGFQQQVVDTETRFGRRSEDFLQVLQQRLSEEHEAHRWEMQQVQGAVASESSRLQVQIADLDARIATLDESARRLESDLNTHLAGMASDIVSRARTELEGTVDVVVKELGTLGAKELTNQLNEACGRLKSIQKGMEAAVSESLRVQAAETLQFFEQTIEELARHSVGRWRLALAGDLNSLAKILGEELRLDSVSDANKE